MAYQDEFYEQFEANTFFDRWSSSNPKHDPLILRSQKKEILLALVENFELKDAKVLEIGAFIGDLLHQLQTSYFCKVHGIDTSSKACDFAYDNYGLRFENKAFTNSSLFSLAPANKATYDVVICDDVLSWFSREDILPSLGVIDWLLKPGGIIFLRDFSTHFGYRYENHHWPNSDIYNYKQPNGHKSYFLSTGRYFEKFSLLRNTGKYQKVFSAREDSMTWCDTILQKHHDNLFPLLSID